ncbi:hypothetical protein ACHRV1_25885 [Flavobacterium aquidurense]|uniref:hypothetical protein n=1 Tax=Flavobacterium TaxID=237 RepID=UPI003757DF04
MKKEKELGICFKASLFGKNAGLQALELHLEKSKTALKTIQAKKLCNQPLSLYCNQQMMN